MSADREPTAVEVIAKALGDARCHPDCWLTTSNSAAAALAALKAAGFVVATRDEIRAMTPQQQAELIGGEVGYWSFYDNGKPHSHIQPFEWIGTGEVTPPEEIADNLRRDGRPVKKRALGPWVEVQP